LAIGQFIHVAVGPAGLILNMSGCERYTYRVVAFSTIFNIILCFFLIDIYGVVGVAVSTSISISMQNILLSFIVFYKLDINTLPSFKLKLN
jgi:O-antigen/teichoic acid export membrane protein